MATRRMRYVVALLLAAVSLPLAAPTPAGAAPGTPVLTGPADTATVSANPVLAWNRVTGAVRYDVQVSTSPTFTPAGTIVFTQSTANTRATPPNDFAIGTYHWRVRAVDSAGATGPYATRSFDKVAADAPVPQTPADGDTLEYPAPLVLSWEPMAGAKSYNVQVDDDPLFQGAAPAVSTNNTAFTPTDPPPLGTTQYWRVQAVSSTNVVSQFSPVRSYTMVWTQAPQLQLPTSTNTPTVEEIVLDWAPLPGAASYNLQISPDEEFNAPIGGTRSVRATSFAPSPTLPNGAYFWRVQGVSTSGQPSPWSAPFVFTRAWPADSPSTYPNGTEGDLFRQVALLEPADDDFTLTEPVFSWTPQREASAYEIQIGTDVNFSPGSFSTCTTNRTVFSPSSQCDPAALNPGVVLHWRVRALDGTVQGVFSQVRQFLYDPPLIDQLEPADGATVSVPILRWQPVEAISRYRVTIDPSDPSCGTVTVFVYATVFVPENLGLNCTGPISWFVRSVEPDGDLSRDISVADWPTFTLGTPPTPGASLEPITLTANEPYRPPLMEWNAITGATSYVVWAGVSGSNTFHKMHGSTNRTAFSYAGLNMQAPLNVLLSPGSYDFFVEAIGPGGTITTSGVGTFVIQPLPTTVLLSPADCPPDTCTSLLHDTPTLDWAPVADAGHYIVYLATDPNFTNVTRTWSTFLTELTPLESLADSQAGQATYWFVRPCFTPTACGPFDPSVFPESYAFRKQSFPMTTISPSPGGTVGSGEVTFEWTDYLVTNQQLAGAELVTQEARNYRVQVSTTAGFTNIIDTSPLVDQTTYTAQTVAYPDGPLFWRVQAFDNSNNPLTFSPAVAFTKASPAPTLQSPAAGASVNGAPVLRWGAMPFSISYEVEVYRNVGQPLALGNRAFQAITRSTASVPQITLPPGTYGWRVRRIDTGNRLGPWTADTNTTLRLFTVGGPAPTLLSPDQGAVLETVPLLLDWAGAPGATRYTAEASVDPTFTSLIESFTTDTTAWAPGLLAPTWPATQIYWRVKSLDAGGNVLAVSGTRSFVNDSSTAGEFTGVAPFRILDTRNAGSGGPIGSGQTRTLKVTGVAGSDVPNGGVSAVVLNVTAVTPTAGGFLTVFPGNVAQRPNASSVNFLPGQIVPNLVTVGVDAAGNVKIYNNFGITHVVVDIVGYYSNGTLPRATRFVPAVSPTRIIDTRGGSGQPSVPLLSGETRTIEVAGEAGVPNDAVSVVMNVTAVAPTADGFLTVFPAGHGLPNASNVNFTAGVIAVPNLAVVPLGAGGDVSVRNSFGTTHLILDVVGWYEAGDPADGARLNPLPPARILDTRSTLKYGNFEIRPLQIRGQGGVPNSAAATAVVLNVTVTEPEHPGFLTAYPTGFPRPTASNLNYNTGQTVANLVVARIGTDGRINLYTHTATHVVVDVVAWFSD